MEEDKVQFTYLDKNAGKTVTAAIGAGTGVFINRGSGPNFTWELYAYYKPKTPIKKPVQKPDFDLIKDPDYAHAFDNCLKCGGVLAPLVYDIGPDAVKGASYIYIARCETCLLEFECSGGGTH